MERRIVPFYMAYPLPVNYQDEQEMVRDMEYLQSQHSMEIRQLRKQLQDLLRAHPELSADRRAWRDDPMMEAGLFEQNGMPRRDETL